MSKTRYKLHIGIALVVCSLSFVFYFTTVAPLFGRALAPGIQNITASNIESTRAKLSVDIDSSNQVITEKGFEYGVDTNYGQVKHDYSPIVGFSQQWARNSSISSYSFKGMAKVNSVGDVYITDSNVINGTKMNKVRKFSSSGVLLQTLTGGPGYNFLNPVDVAFDSDDNVYVIETGDVSGAQAGGPRWRIQKFNANGTFIKQFGYNISITTNYSELRIAIDSDNALYIADPQCKAGCLNKYINDNPTPVLSIGASGPSNQQVTRPDGLAINSLNQVIVHDLDNDPSIRLFDSNGTFIRSWSVAEAIPDEYWDASSGYYSSLAIDIHDDIYLGFLATGTGRTAKFDMYGQYLGSILPRGRGSGTIDSLYSFATGPSGELYTIDEYTSNYVSIEYTSRLQKFTALTPSASFSVQLDGLTCTTVYHYRPFAVIQGEKFYGNDNQFTSGECAPGTDAITQSASDVLADSATLNGGLDGDKQATLSRGFEYGADINYGQRYEENINKQLIPGSTLTLDPNMTVRDVTQDNDGNVYILGKDDNQATRIIKKEPNGTTTTWLTGIFGSSNAPGYITTGSDGSVYLTENYTAKTVYKFSSSGSLLTQFTTNTYCPIKGIAVDSEDYIYVATYCDQNQTYQFRDNGIHKYNSVGTEVLYWGTAESIGYSIGDTSFYVNPLDIAVDNYGELYVANQGRMANYDGGFIKKFSPDGFFQKRIFHPEDTYVFRPFGMFIDSSNNVFVADYGNYAIKKFSSTGTLLGDWSTTSTPTEFNRPVDLVKIDDTNLLVVEGSTLRNFSFSDVTASFQTSLSDLSCGTTYHYRAFATTELGTTYGDDETFQTAACAGVTDFGIVKTLETSEAAQIGDDATYHFEITNLGETAVDYSGYIFDILPVEISLSNSYASQINNSQVSCEDRGLAQDITDTYWRVHYTGHHIVACTIDADGNLLAPGASISVELAGTINNSYTYDAFTNGAVYLSGVGPTQDSGFYQLFLAAVVDEQDILQLDSNNVTTHTYVPGNLPPDVTVQQPEQAQEFEFGATVPVEVSASDPDGTIQSVEIVLDGQLHETLQDAPYEISLIGLPAGEHEIFARATDNNGAVTTSDVVSFVVNTALPVVETYAATDIGITSATLQGQVISVGSSVLVQRGFEIGLTTSYGTDITASGTGEGSFNAVKQSLSCETTYNYRAFATNASGKAVGLNQIFTTGTCQLPPQVQITAPTNKQSFDSKTTRVDLTASASSITSTIERVDFYVDGTYVGTVAQPQPPYILSYSGLAVGTHTLVVVAVDVLGVSTTSTPVTFYVLSPNSLPVDPSDDPVPDVAIPGITTTFNPPVTTNQPLVRDAVPTAVGKLPAKIPFRQRVLSWRVFPFLFVSLLLILALLYTIQSLREYERKLRALKMLAYYQQLSHNIAVFLTVTAHYINTPLATMNAAIELLTNKHAIAQQIAESIHTHLKDLQIFSDGIQAESKSLLASSKIKAQKKTEQLNLLSSFKQKKVWSILLSVGVVIAVFDTIAILSGAYKNLGWQFWNHLILFVAGSILLVVAVHFQRTQKAVRVFNQHLIFEENTLNLQRTKYLTTIARSLGTYYKQLDEVSGELRTEKQAQLYFNGLAGLGALQTSLARAGEFMVDQAKTDQISLSNTYLAVVDELQDTYKSKNIKIIGKIDPTISVLASPEQAHYLLFALLDNAMKFSLDGSSITVYGQANRRGVKIRVLDNGIGITQEQINRLYQPFSRGTSVETFNFEGMGLGLYSLRMLIDKMNGKLSIHNKSGHEKGTIAEITLPKVGNVAAPGQFTRVIKPQTMQ